MHRIIASIRRGQPFDKILTEISNESRIVQMNFVALACDNLGIAPPVRGNVWTRITNPYQLDGQVNRTHILSAIDVVAKQDGVRLSWPGDNVKTDFLQLHREGMCNPVGIQVSNNVPPPMLAPKDQPTDKADAKKFFDDFPELFFACVQKHYPLTESQIERHRVHWDWERLSENETLAWSQPLVEQYKDDWCWINLSGNESIGWTAELIGEYADYFDFDSTSWRDTLPWSESLIDKHADRWCWETLCRNASIPWTPALIERHGQRISESDGGIFEIAQNPAIHRDEALIEAVGRLDGGWVSLSSHFPWTPELLNRYAPHIYWPTFSSNDQYPWSAALVESGKGVYDWASLSANPRLPWSQEFFDRYKDRWVWASKSANSGISGNPSLPWSTSFIAKYATRWDWKLLSRNTGVPWTEELIEQFEDCWDWDGLSRNPKLPWSLGLIERYESRWKWVDHIGLSGNKSIPWSKDLIHKYADRWDWMILCLGVQDIPWSMELIEQFSDKCDFKWLSINHRLPWSQELFRKFHSKWDLDYAERYHFGIAQLVPDEIDEMLARCFGNA